MALYKTELESHLFEWGKKRKKQRRRRKFRKLAVTALMTGGLVTVLRLLRKDRREPEADEGFV